MWQSDTTFRYHFLFVLKSLASEYCEGCYEPIAVLVNVDQLVIISLNSSVDTFERQAALVAKLVFSRLYIMPKSELPQSRALQRY